MYLRQQNKMERYKKMTPLEHIIMHPHSHIGNFELQRSVQWVLRQGSAKFTLEEIAYSPVFFKMYDEVIVNAADNYQRDRKMSKLNVHLNEPEGWVRVYNNGKGIPVEIHKDSNIYVPQLIFGHLITGSNNEKMDVPGSRSGYGAKLANNFSHRFQVECGDKKNMKKFRMAWRQNMEIQEEAEIERYSGEDYTMITYHPSFSYFGMEAFDTDILALMRKRVYDMAGLLPEVVVCLNGRQLPVNSFWRYADMYLPMVEGVPKARDLDAASKWQVLVSRSDGEFKQVSFVNGVCTSKGGTHVDVVVEQIVEKIREKLQKKDKNINLKPYQIKGHLWVFVNAIVENPVFDSQAKRTLTLSQSRFRSECTLSDKMIKGILKSQIFEGIYIQAKNLELCKVAMAVRPKKLKITGISKLEDANEAGTCQSHRCTLILTDGDSAKSFAMAGLEVVGRDYYGVFPLKGRLPNVRECANNTLNGNAEIQSLIKIIGLEVKKEYKDVSTLRYGSIMIMANQDTDGSHIKGLVINFIHTHWPSLFRIEGFLQQFITPLLKASKGREVYSFYTMIDFKQWAENVPDLNSWRVKYYKGLGTNTDKQAQEYFQQLKSHCIAFRYQGEEDDEAIKLIFSKKKAEKRKEWLSRYDSTTVMTYDRPVIGYKYFIERDFIHFSNEDNKRSIASVIDGFKPGQRKIIFACFKRNLREEIKVAQLVGYVAEHSAYHHGEISLTQTIVKMAHNFVGSNNINLLMPNGQFGSRYQGGKDHASARSIYTNLSRVTRALFPEHDDHTLTYIEDDGQLVEPEFYVPIIPMVLVNGCEGIGSGWSTFIPNHNPREIAQLLVEKLNSDTDFEPVAPWYKGFSGEIWRKEDGNFEIKCGVEADEENDRVFHIKELPVGKWTKDFKEYLQQLIALKKVSGLREYHTKNRVHFEVEIDATYMADNRPSISILEKLFKLNCCNITMRNMVGFDSSKRLHRYDSAVQIMEQFFAVRLSYYEKRKEYLISKLNRDREILANKERFILDVVEGRLVLFNKKKARLVEELESKGYTKYSHFPKLRSTKLAQEREEVVDGEGVGLADGEANQYKYLLGMPLQILTFEEVQQLKKSRLEKENEILALELTNAKSIWKADLIQFLTVLDEIEFEEGDEEIHKVGSKQNPCNSGIRGKKNYEKDAKPKGKGKGEKKGINWNTDSEFVSENPLKAEKTEWAEKSKQGGRGCPKKVKEEIKQGAKEEDLLSRVRRRIQVEKCKLSNGENLVAIPVESKPKTLSNMLDDNDSQQVEVIARQKPYKRSQYESSEASESQSEQDWGMGSEDD